MADLYTTLATRIRAGHYSDGSWLPSERDLAAELGVARTTLRRAMDRLAQDGLLECLPGRRPIVRTRGGAARPLKAIALLMGSETSYRPFSQILRGCEQELRRAGYLLVYLDTWAETGHSSQERARREREALESLRQHTVAGLIIWCQEPEASLPLLQELGDRGVAVVTLDREVEGLDADHAGIDNYRAATAAVRHLLALGHRRIAYVNTPEEQNITTIAGRHRALLDALRRHDLPAGPEATISVSRLAGAAAVADHLRPLLSTRKLPTAFFAMNDMNALRLVDALRSLGLRMPEDVSVMGFDNVEAHIPGTPFLTTIEQPFSELGRAAGQLVLQRLSEPTMIARQLLLETHLVERGSVGPPPGSARVDAGRRRRESTGTGKTSVRRS